MRIGRPVRPGYRRQLSESEARALEFARNTRLKFERVYESARKALAAGDSQKALVKCRAALDLLNEENLYGSHQRPIQEALIEQIRRLSQQS